MSTSVAPAAALRERTPSGRILSLDALRGIAAFVVLWHHFRLCFTTDEPVWYLRPLFAGHPSVILFFVLSGYVLSLPIWRDRQPGYPRYLVRRFWRIYVPYAAAGLLAFLVGRHLLFAPTNLTDWFHVTWQTPFTAGFLLRELLTASIDGKLNTAFWSLRYEIEMSLLFPLLCYALGRLPTWVGVVVTALLWKVPSYLLVNEHLLSGPKFDVLASVKYGSCFLLGALMARESARIGALYRRLPGWSKWLGLLVTVATFYAPREGTVQIGACGVMIFGEYSRAQHWLTTTVPEYLGRISYSMYLVHGTVLWATMILVRPHVPLAVLPLLYLATVLPLSHLFCIGIEEPAMRLGRRFSSSPGPVK